MHSAVASQALKVTDSSLNNTGYYLLDTGLSL